MIAMVIVSPIFFFLFVVVLLRQGVFLVFLLFGLNSGEMVSRTVILSLQIP